ncbi:DUF4148 domain-containing protein [Paraburkholderia sp. NMBU_R16]|uniref:DUF4148 domain-containing protein n=1 Tax=Paraburkholderia sp. NMBU_R16 TaxID=2698676 RepID=UPI0015630056|nr:DUF4148 domain-containing protein [Paraburkholderia sp. NMBU_R16]NRO97556.1 DUF4148 domain-containing protein [Paraburkholderia sp. NMBU_R16]
MKALIKAAAVALALTAPALSFAQSNNQPLTRAEVRADLERAMKAGYNPSDRMHYPENIQAAQARIAAENASRQAAAAQDDTSGVGGAGNAAESGHAAEGSVSSYSPPIYKRY